VEVVFDGRQFLFRNGFVLRSQRVEQNCRRLKECALDV